MLLVNFKLFQADLRLHITQLLCEFHSYTLNVTLGYSNFHLQSKFNYSITLVQ